jgi:hypothetical protein
MLLVLAANSRNTRCRVGKHWSRGVEALSNSVRGQCCASDGDYDKEDWMDWMNELSL